MSKITLPVLPLRDIVVFPHMVAPLFVGRKQSVNALNNVMLGDKKILLLSQKNSEIDNPSENNLYKLGTVAKVLQLLKLPDGTIKVLVEGIKRAKVEKLLFHKEFITANILNIDESYKNNSNVKALVKIVIEQFDEYHKINKKISNEIINNIKTYSDANKVADLVIVNLNISIKQKQELLEITKLEDRLNKIYSYLVSEIDSFQERLKEAKTHNDDLERNVGSLSFEITKLKDAGAHLDQTYQHLEKLEQGIAEKSSSIAAIQANCEAHEDKKAALVAQIAQETSRLAMVRGQFDQQLDRLVQVAGSLQASAGSFEQLAPGVREFIENLNATLAAHGAPRVPLRCGMKFGVA